MLLSLKPQSEISCKSMLLLAVIGAYSATAAQAESIGQFENHGDIGDVGKPGTAQFDSATGAYTVAGGGANMWFNEDELHYVWKKCSGDVTISADISWVGSGGDPHRKACLIIRENLESNSAYADAAVHGDGLTSLQYREISGAPTHEIQSSRAGPKSIRIEKRGEYVSMSVGDSMATLRPSGGTFRIKFPETYLIGLGVCAHNDERLESAIFSNVSIDHKTFSGSAGKIESTLETIAIASTDRRVVYHTVDHIEAPNWSRDGQSLLFNSRGSIYRMPVNGGTPVKLDTGSAIRNNNDHGISPDGTMLAISDQTKPGGSRIYTLPIAGGMPKRITELAPSYWHGWSPDGRVLAYCAQRKNEFDIYSISVEGGTETRLTTAVGLDDGPEYSVDGKTIYFNSDRTGTMQIWRMNSDGSDQRQVTSDGYNDWFPHPSPDGLWLVFLSYQKDVMGHPANKNVELRLMPAQGGEIRTIAKLFGGQGTINVPSWSPDSRRIAFVSYQFAVQD